MRKLKSSPAAGRELSTSKDRCTGGGVPSSELEIIVGYNCGDLERVDIHYSVEGHKEYAVLI
jgi:hypothetical protein